MEEQEEDKKVTLLDQIAISVCSPKEYKQLLKLRVPRLVLFMAILSFLLAFIEFGIDAIFWINGVGGFRNLATNELPAFTYQDGKLSMDSDAHMEIGSTTLYINTESAEASLDSMESDGTYITIGSENIVMGIVSGGQSYTYMNTPLKYLMLPDGFNNSELASMAPLFYVYVCFMFLFVMIARAARQLLMAFVYCILGWSMAKNLETGLSFGQVYEMCIYGQTAAMLLMSVNVALDGILPSMVVWAIAIFASMMYVSRAVFSYSHVDGPHGWL